MRAGRGGSVSITGLGILVVGTLLLASSASTVVADERPGFELPEHLKEMRAILDEAAAGGDTVALARRLAALGPDVVPEILVAIRDTAHQFRASGRKAVLERSLRFIPADQLLPLLRSAALGEVELGARIRALRIIRLSCARGGMGLTLSIATELGTTGDLASPRVQSAIRGTVGALIEESPSGWRTIERAWPDLSPQLGELLLSMQAGSGMKERAEFLLRLLVRSESANPRLLERIAALPVRGPASLGASAAMEVAGAIVSEDAAARRAGVLVLGRFHQAESFPEIISLLEDEDESVRKAACRSLERLSGRRFGPDAARWETWFGQECRWIDDEMQTVVEQLHSEKQGVVLEALHLLGGKKLFRVHLVARVADQLGHPDPVVRTAACEALGRLKDPQAIEPLQGALDDDVDTVRRAAALALSRITSLPAPENLAAWLASLNKGR